MFLIVPESSKAFSDILVYLKTIWGILMYFESLWNDPERSEPFPESF